MFSATFKFYQVYIVENYSVIWFKSISFHNAVYFLLLFKVCLWSCYSSYTYIYISEGKIQNYTFIYLRRRGTLSPLECYLITGKLWATPNISGCKILTTKISVGEQDNHVIIITWFPVIQWKQINSTSTEILTVTEIKHK